jgi:putative endonuclease
MSYYLYILKSLSATNWYYVEISKDVTKRLKEHNKSSVKSTKSKRPLKIIYTETYENITKARKKELS